jgi:trimeric autotransporter adhesin
MLSSQFARAISVVVLCATVVGCSPTTSTTPTTTTTTTSQTPPFTLSGKVLQAGTSNGIGSATVTLTPASSAPLTTTTDASGAFSFSGLTTSGAYSLQVVASGYVPVTTALTIPVASFTINLSVSTPPQPVPMLTVSGQASLSAVGQTSQLTATVTNIDGTTSDVTTVAKWSSSNPAVAQVSSSGLVTAFSAGVTVITATLTNETGAIGVTVTF